LSHSSPGTEILAVDPDENVPVYFQTLGVPIIFAPVSVKLILGNGSGPYVSVTLQRVRDAEVVVLLLAVNTASRRILG
jgi:hypothetical protein